MDSSSRIQFGSCEVDPPGRVLFRRGEHVEVQAKVLDLLLYLIEHRERVVPSDELLDALWPGVAVTPSSLSRAIHKARVAVGDDGEEQSTIATVRGRGFRFVAPLHHPAAISGEPASSFVGREVLMEEIDDLLESARGGRGRVVLLSGEAGIGKTRVAQEAAARAEAAGFALREGWCTEEPGAPAYWPWIQLVRGEAQARGAEAFRQLVGRAVSELAKIVPELGGEKPEVLPRPRGERPAQFRISDALARLVRALALERPFLLLLEDLHWADPPSLRALGFVAREIRTAPVLVIGTYRTEEVGRGHALVDEEATLLRSSDHRHFELEGLSPTEVELLVGKLSEGAELPAQAIWERTAGNPFFVTEIVRHLREQGTPGERAPLSAVPTGIRAVIQRGLARLSGPSRHCVSVAAMIGPRFALRALEASCELGRGPLLEALEEAQSRGIVEPVPGSPGAYAFDHELVRDAVLGELSSRDRARIHGRIASALEELHPDDPNVDLAVAGQLLSAARNGGDAKRALEATQRAARQALARRAYEDAARQLEYALEALELCGTRDDARRCELLLESARCFVHFDFERSRRLLLEAFHLARELEPSAFRVLLPAIVAEAADLRVDDTELRAAVKEVLDSLAPGEEAAQVALLAAAGRGCLRGDPDADLLSSRIVEFARRSGDASVLGTALCAWHWVHSAPESRCGRWQAVQEIERLGAAAGPKALLDGRFLRAVDALEMADRPGLLTALEDLDRGARETRHPLSRWRALVLRSMLAALEGHLARAERLSDEALALACGHGLREFDAFIAHSSQLCDRAYLRGDVEPIVAGLRALVASAPGKPINELALANSCLEVGDSDGARACLERCSREELVADSSDVVVAHLLARVASDLGEPSLCEAVRPLLLPYRGLLLVQADPLASFGPAGRYLGLLSWALEEWDAAEAWFVEDLEIGLRLEIRGEILIDRTHYARMLAARGRKGDRRAAREQLALARSDANRLGLPGALRRIDRVGAALAAS